MKVLLDSCVWGGAKKALVEAGHSVEWCGDWLSDPGDDLVLEKANAGDQVLITADKDFGELAVVFGKPHKGIIRLVDRSVTQQGPVSVAVLNKYGSELSAGAVITVELGRVRVRPPE